jgi:predicted dehydrogenase
LPKLNVAVVGLGFGAEFVPIYRHHPDVATVGVCDSNPSVARRVAGTFAADRVYDSFGDVLADPSVDAVHLVTPLTDHAPQTLAALSAGKHCACTVPMALSFADLAKIVELQESAGLTYMMMETAVFTREFLHVQDMVRQGQLGDITFGRGAHLQDMTGWPAYWRGLPPMWYATHAISPLLSLLGTRAVAVHALGSGRLPPSEAAVYGNPYPAETAIIRLADSPVALEVTRTLSRTARPYVESFCIYGDRQSFEWAQLEDAAPPLIFAMSDEVDSERQRHITVTQSEIPDQASRLPPPIRQFTQRGVYTSQQHLSMAQGAGHGGSHPHLVHEFVRSVVEGREPAVSAGIAADWTAAGIAAHASAMRDGAAINVPSFTRHRPER